MRRSPDRNRPLEPAAAKASSFAFAAATLSSRDDIIGFASILQFTPVACVHVALPLGIRDILPLSFLSRFFFLFFCILFLACFFFLHFFTRFHNSPEGHLRQDSARQYRIAESCSLSAWRGTQGISDNRAVRLRRVVVFGFIVFTGPKLFLDLSTSFIGFFFRGL